MTIYSPRTLADALAHLNDDSEAVVLAGGTDMMVEVNFARRRPTSVVSLRHVADLKTWSIDTSTSTITIGSGVTYTELEHGPLAVALPALAEASRTVGSPQIRNAATIGGNLGTCSPAGDTLPVLSALDATINLVSTENRRSIGFHEFMVGPKRTSRARNEIIESITMSLPSGWQGYAKVGTRNAMVISVASCCLVLDEDNSHVRVALGSVGPTIIRASTAENAYAERELSSGEFGSLVAQDARPIDDHRSTAEYRRHAIRILAGRLLERGLSS